MKNKHGMFFTIMVIFIIILFFMSFAIYDVVKDRSSVNKRIQTMNNFVFSLDQDIPRYLYIAGFRSVLIFNTRIVSSGSYINDIDSSFQELFFNGTLNGEPQSLMNGAMFRDMQSTFSSLAEKVNANVTFSYPQVRIQQTDPWNVNVSFIALMFIEDNGKLVSWNRTVSSSTLIPIDNFEDPFYIVNTNSLVPNKIRKTPYSFGNVVNFTSHATGSYYFASASAPSFLDRLQGINAANPNGIESFVYLPSLSAQGIIVKDKSCIDYIYFSSNNPASYHVTGMPSWFKIDTDHVNQYNVSGLTY